MSGAEDKPKLLQFIETTVFTRRLRALGLEDDLQALQEFLLANPQAGDLDPGTGGLRKVRVAARGKGKSGGARVHYLYLAQVSVIYLIFVYGKDDQVTLTEQQKKQLKAIVDKIKEEWQSRR